MLYLLLRFYWINKANELHAIILVVPTLHPFANDKGIITFYKFMTPWFYTQLLPTTIFRNVHKLTTLKIKKIYILEYFKISNSFPKNERKLVELQLLESPKDVFGTNNFIINQ